MLLLFEPESALCRTAGRQYVHGIIRKHRHLILLRSSRFDYYRFPGGEIVPDETPEAALIRIVQEETGLTVLPESIRICCCAEEKPQNADPDAAIRLHCYYYCDTAENKLPHDTDAERFLPVPVLLPDALALNRTDTHGIISDNAAFLAMLERETAVMDYLYKENIQPAAETVQLVTDEAPKLFTPKAQKWTVRLALIISIISLVFSVLSPLIAGAGAAAAGIADPNQGGMMPADSAFSLYALIWTLLIIPGALLSLIALALSLTALGIRLFFRRSKIIGTAAFAVAWTAFGYVMLFTLPWLVTLAGEWLRA